MLHQLGHQCDGVALRCSEEELVVESIALTVCGGLGLDTSGYSIPYLASWSADEQAMEVIERCAGLIDRLAKRIEDAVADAQAD